MKESFYFSHDSNARNDVKVLKLRRNLGLEGYGIYWCIIEILRDSPGYTLSMNNIEDISFSLNIENDKVLTVIKNFDLFIIEEENFFSERLLRSMEQYKALKERKSQSGKNGMKKRWSKPNQQNKMIL
jgi:hypothetical protein